MVSFEKKTGRNHMAQSVRFIQRAQAQPRMTPMTTDGVHARGEPAQSVVLPFLAIGLLAFVALGSTPPPPAYSKAAPNGDAGRPAGGGTATAAPPAPGMYDIDGALATALAPIAAIGALVAAIKSEKLPTATERIAVRLIEYDLTVLFITVAYAHYVLNVEHANAASDEARYFDAMMRVGGFVFAWWVARRMLAGRKPDPAHQGGAFARRD